MSNTSTKPQPLVAGMVRRLVSWRPLFGDDNPMVYILAPSLEKPVPAGDTRRGTAWLFRELTKAQQFAEWTLERHGLDAVVVSVHIRQLATALAPRDLTWVLDPEPVAGYGKPFAFKAPLLD